MLLKQHFFQIRCTAWTRLMHSNSITTQAGTSWLDLEATKLLNNDVDIKFMPTVP